MYHRPGCLILKLRPARSLRRDRLHVDPVLLIALVVAEANGSPGKESTYVIEAASGYGVEDCLGEGGASGQVVADAWCADAWCGWSGTAVKFGISESPAENAATHPYFRVVKWRREAAGVIRASSRSARDAAGRGSVDPAY